MASQAIARSWTINTRVSIPATPEQCFFPNVSSGHLRIREVELSVARCIAYIVPLSFVPLSFSPAPCCPSTLWSKQSQHRPTPYFLRQLL